MPAKITAIGPRKQLAALPWRRRDDGVEVLLITSRVSRHWLIPKGWPMKGKSSAAAAAREAFEEAGVRGTTSPTPIGNYNYEKLLPDGGVLSCAVEVYSLQVEAELVKWPEADERERIWMPVAEATTAAFEAGLADLLRGLDFDAIASGHGKPRRRHKNGR